jgi:hypothetical protein
MLVGSILAGLIGGLVRGTVSSTVGHRVNAFLIRSWLKGEPYYISDFEEIDSTTEAFRFKIRMSGSDDEILIQPVQNKLIRVVAEREFGDAPVATLLDSHRARRRVRTEIEAAMVNSRVVYGFVNAEGDSVDLKNATGVVVEYRIYSDDISRKELIDGMVKVDNAVEYIESRPEAVDEDYSRLS